MQSNIESIFKKFTSNTGKMDGKTFAKFAKDCGLLDKKLNPTEVDLIFAKVKGTSAIRVIGMRQFEEGISLCATKKGVSLQEIKNKVSVSQGPRFTGTKADSVKFHDDKNLYTGVYAHGGPSTIDINKGMISDIA